MRRIYEDHAYSQGPVERCYWDTTVARPPRGAAVEGEVRAEVAILGAGYAGLSAALHLARDAGADVAVVEAEGIGWGASGRNGGFACIGGAKAGAATLRRRFGQAGLDEWHGVQRQTPGTVAGILDRYAIDADTHSREGETSLAHSPRAFAALREEAVAARRDLGVTAEVLGPADLAAAGMGGAGFHGGLRIGLGFALNPLKYVLGLAVAARAEGARIYENSPVEAITREGGDYLLRTPRGRLRARKLILATNGYSSEDVPGWMAGRYLPAQSAVLVTRQLTAAEIAAQGWSSQGMAYDTRDLLHYFRLMPDGRFLFGLRGGTAAGPRAQEAMRARARADFEAMFPAWAVVATPHYWSGFVCLSRGLTPYVGPVGDWPDAWAGFAWHGNGVALATWSGRLLADLATGRGRVPAVMAAPPGRFPFGAARRFLLPLAYAWYGLRDRA
ncbi:NAD(P)/FAD-dependent oxidoreductase [Albidovulum sp.]|uniref:NAD(P)/FAD-dependent oxidoreductase n=1 Tax=Albidovulum sp. TaxID=1872424 RepID=UPI0039B85212